MTRAVALHGMGMRLWGNRTTDIGGEHYMDTLPLRRAQRLPTRRHLLWGLLLGPRTHLARLACCPRRGCSEPFSLPVAIYYSFVTLTTLGYDDIVPRSEVMRGLAIM